MIIATPYKRAENLPRVADVVMLILVSLSLPYTLTSSHPLNRTSSSIVLGSYILVSMPLSGIVGLEHIFTLVFDTNTLCVVYSNSLLARCVVSVC